MNCQKSCWFVLVLCRDSRFNELHRFEVHSERFILSALVTVVPPLTQLSRHQVHQAALLPSAGDGPLLPHVLEHLPLG